VEDHPVVETLPGEKNEIVDGLRGTLGEELECDVAVVGLQLRGVFGGEVNRQIGCGVVLFGQK
jgi:hypothetical protein